MSQNINGLIWKGGHDKKGRKAGRWVLVDVNNRIYVEGDYGKANSISFNAKYKKVGTWNFYSYITDSSGVTKRKGAA